MCHKLFAASCCKATSREIYDYALQVCTHFYWSAMRKIRFTDKNVVCKSFKVDSSFHQSFAVATLNFDEVKPVVAHLSTRKNK